MTTLKQTLESGNFNVFIAGRLCGACRGIGVVLAICRARLPARSTKGRLVQIIEASSRHHRAEGPPISNGRALISAGLFQKSNTTIYFTRAWHFEPGIVNDEETLITNSKKAIPDIRQGGGGSGGQCGDQQECDPFTAHFTSPLR